MYLWLIAVLYICRYVIDNMLDNIFKQLGLTRNEQEIYLFLLEYGKSIASLIGKRLGIKRATVYASLESLENKGLVHKYSKNEVAYFESESPNNLVKLCEKELQTYETLKRGITNIMPQLEEIESKQAKPSLEIKGKLKFYQGANSVKELIDETLLEKDKEQLCIGISKYHIDNPDTVWHNYTEKRTKLGMKVRSIQTDHQINQKYKARDKDELRETKLIPEKKFNIPSELNIIGDMIALFVTDGNEPMGIKLYNKEMAQIVRTLFELAWIGADKIDQ